MFYQNLMANSNKHFPDTLEQELRASYPLKSLKYESGFVAYDDFKSFFFGYLSESDKAVGFSLLEFDDLM